MVKAVPRSEVVRYDPARRATVRDGVELVLNPFDQRALRVALDLRRPGERVTVVSLGPPAARPLLREALAAGADRAVHLCDPAFVGSDLLATSAALASALRPLRPGLVVAGARSTDSDTGLVGPQVAGRLGLAIVTLARAIRRGDARSPLEVEVDTPFGRATVEVEPPAVVTVGEKIAKPLPVSPERFAQTPPEAVETVGPAGLGLSPAEVGSFGSPTWVEEVRAVAPVRRARRFADGATPARVRDAIEALRPLLAIGPPPAPPLPWPPGGAAEREVVVLCSDERGGVDAGVLGLLTYLRRALPAHAIAGALYGSDAEERSRERLETSGALGGYVLDPDGARFDSGDVAHGLAAVLERRPKVVAVVTAASPFGREVAGQLAVARSVGSVGDAIEVRAGPDGALVWSKPSFGGATVATVRSRSTPVVATMPRGLASPAADVRSARRSPWTSIRPPPAMGRVRLRAEVAEPSATPDPEGAEVVVAVGMGIGGPDGIARLVPVAHRWGASLVATRRVVDAGWMPARRQVGLTGALLAPRLAVLLGVRGAPNHMIGWARAAAVVAVNRDPDAPVFREADVGIVGPVEEVVAELVEPLAGLLRPPPPPDPR